MFGSFLPSLWSSDNQVYSGRGADTVMQSCLRRVVPMPAVTLEKNVGLMRAPASGRVLRDAGAFCRSPDIEDWIDQRPGGFHVIAAIEECGVTAHAIIYQRGVGAAWSFAKAFFVFEIHIYIADAH